MKITHVLIAMIAFYTVLTLTACPASSETDKNTSNPSWHLVYSDDFNRADGLFRSSSDWTYYDFRNYTNTVMITNNELLIQTGSGNFIYLIYNYMVNYDTVRATLKVRTWTNLANNGIGLAFRLNSPTNFNSLYYSFLLYGGTAMSLWTNSSTSSGTNMLQTMAPDTVYYARAEVSGHQMTMTLMDSNRNLITNVAYNDIQNLYDGGGYAAMNAYGDFFVDDYTLEAFY